jgi:malonate-semialdehyde dehydrogenase (acetylating)/methylmalonate-semialdehyde dehydrogenase
MMKNNILKIALSRRLTKFISPNVISAAFSSEVVPKVKNFINGQFVDSKTTDWIPLLNPATQEIVCMVPKSTNAELKEAELGIAFQTCLVYEEVVA